MNWTIALLEPSTTSKEDKPESLQIVSLGSEMLIGRFLAVAALNLQAKDPGGTI